ncbi:hypothetical protein [Candidatus Berkiella aquae]|uniref:Uncharacterized protein n=1 Tax=Candidatus Berkiella aquae TaxID=295108 RepID=A0A0Q9YB53_9GAMM|nr:hypothetical protein [Candidatus Berkiella aquae]MCS5710611.1 hypothetical protein [Candidatus Berkiella aquae]
MREWKQLFVNETLFEKTKINKNQLILTLADDYKTSRHMQSLMTNLKYLYNKSTQFSQTFTLPYAQDHSIVFTLNPKQRKVHINNAFNTIAAIISQSMTRKNDVLERSKPEKIEDEKPQAFKAVSKKRDTKALQLSVNDAFEKGELFQSVKISKSGATFEIAEAFNSKEYYRFISQRLNKQQRTSQALAAVSLPIKDLRHKPSLRLKANHQLTAEKLLDLFKTPSADAEKEAVATVPELTTQEVIKAPEVATGATIGMPVTTTIPLLESEVTESSPDITPNSSPEITPESDDSAFEGLDDMLEQLNSISYRPSSYLDLNDLLASGTEGYSWDPDNNAFDNNVLFQYNNLSWGDLWSEDFNIPSSPEQQQNNLFSSMLKMKNF